MGFSGPGFQDVPRLPGSKIASFQGCMVGRGDHRRGCSIASDFATKGCSGCSLRSEGFAVQLKRVPLKLYSQVVSRSGCI